MSAKKKIKTQNNALTYSISDGVTQTLLQSWKACRLQCLKILQGWEAPGRNGALHFGTAVHWFLEHWYSMPWSATMNRDLWVIENCKQYAEIAGPDAATQDYHDMMALVVPLIVRYVEYWRARDEKLQWESLEQEFDAPVEGFRLRGKIDGLFRRDDGKLWIFETKTKGQISPEDIGRALSFDFQSLFYITAVEEILEEPVAGVLYNVLRRAQLRQGKNETPSDFYGRVYADIHDRPDHYFYRTEATFPAGKKAAFRSSLVKQLAEFSEWLNQVNKTKVESGPNARLTYRNENSCTMRKWNCEFLSACASNNMAGYTQTRQLFRELSNENGD